MNDVGAVIVDFHAEAVLSACVGSLQSQGVSDIVVVENGEPGSTPQLDGVSIVRPGVNLGYGRGVNRGVAWLEPSEFVLVANPDVELHVGAIEAMVDLLRTQSDVAIVGPTILRVDGTTYPSHRVFPNILLASCHALLEPWWPENWATRKYRSPRRDGTVEWVSGACFMIRRGAFEEVGGFDERYFMFAEDMSLCWDLLQRGWRVAVAPTATVTHLEGVSRARVPIRMTLAHHRSALLFEAHRAQGWRRILLPLATLVLGARLVIVLAGDMWSRRRT